MAGKDFKIEQLIIDMIRVQPMFYDKSLPEYHQNFRDKRKEELLCISMAIFQVFQVHKSEEEIHKIWQSLVRKFREEHRNLKQYCASGSKANNNKKKWEFYDSLLWLVPYVEHLPQNESDNWENNTLVSKGMSSEESSAHLNKFKKFKKEKKSDYDCLQELLVGNKKLFDTVQIISNDSIHQETRTGINNYIPLLQKGFSQIPNDKKYQCSRAMLKFIVGFKEARHN